MPVISPPNPANYINNVGIPTDGGVVYGDLLALATQGNTNDARIGVLEASNSFGARFYQGTAPPIYAGVATGTISRISCFDSTASKVLYKAGSTTFDMGTNAVNGRNSITLTGTVATTTANATLTGTGTAFTAQLAKGDYVTIGANTRQILSVTNDTTATFTANGAAIVSGQSATRGNEQADAWYYLYVEGDGASLTGLLISPRNAVLDGTVPEMHSGYSYWRQLPFAVRNVTSDFLPWMVTGWDPPYGAWITYHAHNANVAPYLMLSGGASTSFATINLSTLVPPISNVVDLQVSTQFSLDTGGASRLGYIRTPGMAASNGTGTGQSVYSSGVGFYCLETNPRPRMVTNSSQQLEYKVTSATINITVDAIGFGIVGAF